MPLIMATKSFSTDARRRRADAVSQPDFAKTECLRRYSIFTTTRMFAEVADAKIVRHINNNNLLFHHLLS